MTGHHLAQLNVGTLRHALDDPRMHGFTSMLDIVNEVADRASGFVWRLVDDGGNDATAIRTSLGAEVIVTMSVWESRESLWDYVYRSGHLDLQHLHAHRPSPTAFGFKDTYTAEDAATTKVQSAR